MFGLNEPVPPVIAPPPEKKGWGAGAIILIVAACILLEIPGYLLWKRTRQAEGRVQALTQQAQQLRGAVSQAQADSGVARTEAAQAQASAEQAAQAKAQSDQQAEQAQKQAEAATQQATQAEHQAALASQQATEAQQEAARLHAQRQAELDHLRHVLSQIATTRETDSGLIVTLDSNAIRFDFDKATIRPGNRESLSRMAGVLMTLDGYQIYVYGYTDDVGTAQYNQKLSERRAAAVRDCLVQSGVDAKIIDSKGYGKSDPLETGESAQARAKNRRVEIGIVDSVLRVEPGAPSQSPTAHN
jgi:outer membrane protein OmpA-like peptidoglycan-associated protein